MSVTELNHRAASKEEIANSGTTVASIFFKNVFGEKAQKVLTVFVALRYVVNAYHASTRLRCPSLQCVL